MKPILKNVWEYYEHIGILHKTIGKKVASHSWKQSIFTQMMFTHASGMLQVVLGWTQVLHSWTQVHSAQLQSTTRSSYIMSRVRHKWLGSATYVSNWLSKSLTSREHASGYMRRPCEGHEMGCLLLLLLKPNTGSEKRYENHTQMCHFTIIVTSDRDATSVIATHSYKCPFMNRLSYKQPECKFLQGSVTRYTTRHGQESFSGFYK